jgi:hypothetical protein
VVMRYYMVYTKKEGQKNYHAVDVNRGTFTQVSRLKYATKYSSRDLPKLRAYLQRMDRKYPKVAFVVKDNKGNFEIDID